MEMTAPASTGDLNVERWLGRREAFALVAGHCTAADVQCLKELRNGKLYQSHASTWSEFCDQHVGMSKRYVNRLISNLEEFGPRYFELSHATAVSPRTFRAIEPYLQENGLECEGEIVPMTPENARKVTAAVAKLRGKAAAPTFATIVRRSEELIAMIGAVEHLTTDQLHALGALVFRLRDAAGQAGVHLVVR